MQLMRILMVNFNLVPSETTTDDDLLLAEEYYKNDYPDEEEESSSEGGSGKPSPSTCTSLQTPTSLQMNSTNTRRRTNLCTMLRKTTGQEAIGECHSVFIVFHFICR
jgi:hypothetical protein